MQRRTMLGTLLGTALLAYAEGARTQPVPGDAASSLAPSGRLRVAINYGNAVLARRALSAMTKLRCSLDSSPG